MSVTEPEEGPAPFEPDVEQAAALRERAAKDGMRFSAYLPPSLAAWVLDEIIAGRFSILVRRHFAPCRICRH